VSSGYSKKDLPVRRFSKSQYQWFDENKNQIKNFYAIDVILQDISWGTILVSGIFMLKIKLKYVILRQYRWKYFLLFFWIKLKT
jgi:hypothetical protein